jgi:hypothetical protein
MKARYTDPPKTEADRHEIRLLIRSQFVELKGDTMVTCAECKRRVPVRFAYHCFNCGLWLCHACSVIHFAPCQAPTKQLAADQTMRTAEVSAAVLAERLRQIRQEGWTPEHDDQWTQAELAQAASAYTWPPGILADTFPLRVLWPWDRAWWKPKDRRRDLVRAAALLLAEIERLDRKAAAV